MLWLLADVSKDAAVNIKDVSVHRIRGVRSKEHSGTSKLRRIEPTTSRRLGADE
jgi:hypothetical protein